MAEFRIGVVLSSTLPAHAPVNAATFPSLAMAVRAATQAAHQMWVNYAMGAPLPDGRAIKNSTGAYARSIMTREMGDFAGEVFTDLAYAAAIEDGTPARDMHDMLGRSLKTRVGKDGKRYLIIPFRTYHSNAVVGARMPAAIEDWWKGVPKDQSSRVTGRGRRLSGTGAFDIKTRAPLTVPAWKYRWGTKLSANTIRSMGLGEEAVKRYAGMYRFQKPKAEHGKLTGAQHTQFISFRTMKEGGTGWRQAARPGYHVAQAVADQIRPLAEVHFREAMAEDVRRFLGAS